MALLERFAFLHVLEFCSHHRFIRYSSFVAMFVVFTVFIALLVRSSVVVSTCDVCQDDQSDVLNQSNPEGIRSETGGADCKSPAPKMFSVKSFISHGSGRYFPRCIELYRCSDDSGCCRNEKESCVPNITEIIFKEIKARNISGIVKRNISFVNHTSCVCSLPGNSNRDHTTHQGRLCDTITLSEAVNTKKAENICRCRETKNFPCKSPQLKTFYAATDIFQGGSGRYTPEFINLLVCDNSSECCPKGQRCAAAACEEVTKIFTSTSYDSSSRKRIRIQLSRQFFNHTSCECKPIDSLT